MTPGRKPSKKRPAPSQIGPKPKKAHLEKPPTKDEKPRVFKRDRPVTVPQTQDSDTSSEGTTETLSGGEDEDEKMLDVPAKDSTSGLLRPVGLNENLMDCIVQLQKRRTRHRKFSLTNAKLLNLMLYCYEMPNAYGFLLTRKTWARNGRSTSPTS